MIVPNAVCHRTADTQQIAGGFLFLLKTIWETLQIRTDFSNQFQTKQSNSKPQPILKKHINVMTFGSCSCEKILDF